MTRRLGGTEGSVGRSRRFLRDERKQAPSSGLRPPSPRCCGEKGRAGVTWSRSEVLGASSRARRVPQNPRPEAARRGLCARSDRSNLHCSRTVLALTGRGRREGHPDVLRTPSGQPPSLPGAGEEADLEEIGLDEVLQRAGVVAGRRGDRLEADRAAFVDRARWSGGTCGRGRRGRVRRLASRRRASSTVAAETLGRRIGPGRSRARGAGGAARRAACRGSAAMAFDCAAGSSHRVRDAAARTMIAEELVLGVELPDGGRCRSGSGAAEERRPGAGRGADEREGLEP
jgi:hypothetical protein